MATSLWLDWGGLFPWYILVIMHPIKMLIFLCVQYPLLDLIARVLLGLFYYLLIVSILAVMNQNDFLYNLMS